MGIQARVWIEAGNFFLRDSAQDSCWLWLLEDTGLVYAMRVSIDDMYQDEKIPLWLKYIKKNPDTPLHNHPKLGWLWPLPNAPVVPNFRWAVSWGRPIRREVEAFAAQLNLPVLENLGALENHRLFLSSCRNYNAFAKLPTAIAEKRLQALRLFPPLLMPLLIDGLKNPDMFGEENDNDWRGDYQAYFNAAAQDTCQELLHAIDNNQNLVKALAKHWHIQRSTVKNPCLHSAWPEGRVASSLLKLLNALPKDKRPSTAKALLEKKAALEALPITTKSPEDIRRLAQMFRIPWQAFWQELQQQHNTLNTAIRNSKDFIQAAMSEVTEAQKPSWLEKNDFALAWLAHLGLDSLLRASERWHNQPLQSQVLLSDLRLESISEGFTHQEASIKELLCSDDFYQEGAAMHHCVADYWRGCLISAERFFHLELTTGEKATAQLKINETVNTLDFYQEELLGVSNAEPSSAMQQLSEDLLHYLNHQDRLAMRQNLVKQSQLREQEYRYGSPQSYRRLDRRSVHESLKVLRYCLLQDDWNIRQNYLYQGAIVGSHHIKHLDLNQRLPVNAALNLKREPDNSYDNNAVAVYWQDNKLGYLPRADNHHIAKLLDTQTVLIALASHKTNPSDYNPFHCIVMFKQEQT